MDTSAWIEFFRGSLEGEQIKEYLFPEPMEIEPTITPTLVITEMRSAYVRDDKEDQFFDDLEEIRRFGRIYDLLEEPLSIVAGEKHARMHNRQNQISYVDCILWTIAEVLDMNVLSTDKHFKDCPQAIYIKKEENNEN
jgi:predicted nucleic acid-binding protein